MGKKITALFFLIGFVVGFVAGNQWAKPKDITKKLTKLDNKSYETFEKIRHTNDIIHSNVSDGTIRLHVRADSETTASMDNGKRAVCDIHREDAYRIIEITKRADECSARLTALQKWVLEHVK